MDALKVNPAVMRCSITRRYFFQGLYTRREDGNELDDFQN